MAGNAVAEDAAAKWKLKKAAGGCTKPFCRFENSLGIKMLITLQKYCELSSYFSHFVLLAGI